MSDRIVLTGVSAIGRHGVLPAERELGQRFVVDVELTLDTRPAAASDDVADTVHYGLLAQDLIGVITGEPVNLIETLADRLAGVVLAREQVTRVQVTVHKPQAPIPVPFADVAVVVTRGRP